jgi:hypothetical protein
VLRSAMPLILPADWMPAGPMQRLIIHWTAGAGFPSPEDGEFYNVLLDRIGRAHLGDHLLTDNLSTADGDYAAHTRGLNTGSIGLALCGMAGASRNPFAPGRYPLTPVQWNNALIAAADLCRRYKLPPDEKHLLMHCEVERVYGIQQRGKWDISVRSWEPGKWVAVTPGEELRARVKLLLLG